MFFDNVQVTNICGPLLEETHYYPFGLTMAGISSKTIGKLENKHKFNGIELNEDLGLNTYDAFFRSLDPQIGRWWQIDPECDISIRSKNSNEDDDEEDETDLESLTPYNSMGNNPIKYSDPKGDIFGINNLIGAVVGAVVDYGVQVATNYANGNSNPWTRNINLTSVGTAFVAGAITSGGSAVKGGIKVSAALVNNTFEVKTSKDGLKFSVEKNPINVVKNATIDMVADASFKKVGGVTTKGMAKVGVDKGTVAKEVKAALRNNGYHITSKLNQSVKSASNTAMKQVSKSAENVTNAATNSTKDKLKSKTNL